MTTHTFLLRLDNEGNDKLKTISSLSPSMIHFRQQPSIIDHNGPELSNSSTSPSPSIALPSRPQVLSEPQTVADNKRKSQEREMPQPGISRLPLQTPLVTLVTGIKRFGSKHMRNGLIVNRLSLPEWIAGFIKKPQVIQGPMRDHP